METAGSKTVVVTGAGGYIGSVLVPKLLDKGYRVKAIDRFFFGRDKLPQHEQLTAVREDVRRLTEDHLAGAYAVIDLVAISNDPSGEWFREATYQINHQARARTARLAKRVGVRRYILPSSCSVYGIQEPGVIADENSPTNPITTYAKANEMAERDVLPLADDDFAVTVMRQATIFGLSPRMRFDLAINGMTYGAFETGKIPLMRDGTQWRPMLHVQDTTDAMLLLLECDPQLVNGQVFNVGSFNCQLGDLARQIVRALPCDAGIEWYGDPDRRSYRVDFGKITRVLGWKAKYTAADGALEIYEALKSGKLVKDDETMTLKWYQELNKWHRIIKERELYGSMLDALTMTG
ncbi:MAG: NAD-dependent dehydratase [Paenibacillaceae bacterium ZCTH02-B3]|nr:MAG: NAD-dependent dehydratase [Paenibacillaceae bacterium ZCTH02-B3]